MINHIFKTKFIPGEVYYLVDGEGLSAILNGGVHPIKFWQEHSQKFKVFAKTTIFVALDRQRLHRTIIRGHFLNSFEMVLVDDFELFYSFEEMACAAFSSKTGTDFQQAVLESEISDGVLIEAGSSGASEFTNWYKVNEEFGKQPVVVEVMGDPVKFNQFKKLYSKGKDKVRIFEKYYCGGLYEICL